MQQVNVYFKSDTSNIPVKYKVNLREILPTKNWHELNRTHYVLHSAHSVMLELNWNSGGNVTKRCLVEIKCGN